MFVNICLLSPDGFFQIYNVLLAIFWPSFFFSSSCIWVGSNFEKCFQKPTECSLQYFKGKSRRSGFSLCPEIFMALWIKRIQSSDRLPSLLPVILKFCFSKPLVTPNTMWKKLLLLPPNFYRPLRWLQKRGPSWKLGMCLSSQIPSPFLCSMYCNKLVASKMPAVAAFLRLPYLYLILCVQIW